MSRNGARWGPHQLRRQHLWQLTSRANKLRQSGAHSQDHSATGATNLASTSAWQRRRGWWGQQFRRRRRHRRLPHFPISLGIASWCLLFTAKHRNTGVQILKYWMMGAEHWILIFRAPQRSFAVVSLPPSLSLAESPNPTCSLFLPFGRGPAGERARTGA